MNVPLVHSLAASALAQAEGGPLKAFDAAAEGPADFQAHVFWAYGAVCLILALFTLWSSRQAARLEARVADLARRLGEAPGSR